jgi:hypothetical protein
MKPRREVDGAAGLAPLAAHHSALTSASQQSDSRGALALSSP